MSNLRFYSAEFSTPPCTKEGWVKMNHNVFMTTQKKKEEWQQKQHKETKRKIKIKRENEEYGEHMYKW